ncbi:MAG TPA: response regulator transcription factor [Elusimicrobiota bacterium]|jgi:DNA-binding response OmpR family regulator|nr:response regulator transcription factor [Elusimicrobiota bacterium]
MKPRALVVEDDRVVADTIKVLLQSEGLQATLAGNADAALAALGGAQFDLLVLDVTLPGFSGIQLCQHLKKQPETAATPVMMVTSMARDGDKVRGLDAGADDYITKPFSSDEFRARVRALLRRSQGGGAAERVWSAKDILLYEERNEVKVKGKPVSLSPKEFELLALFLKKKGRVLTRDFLREAVWGPDSLTTSHTIVVCVAGLRDKLGPLGKFIVPITGKGYKFDDEA